MYYIRHTLYNKFKIIEIKSYFFSKYREYPDRFLSFLRNLFPFISPRETSSRSIKQKYGEMAFINRWVLTAWAKPWVPFRLSREHDGSSGSQVPSHRRFNVGVIVVHGATAAIKDHGNKLIKMSLPIHPTRIAWRFSHARSSHLPRPTRPPLRNVDSPRPLPHLQSTWPHLFLEIRLRDPENALVSAWKNLKDRSFVRVDNGTGFLDDWGIEYNKWCQEREWRNVWMTGRFWIFNVSK